jgi:hypothetical protein
LSSHLLIFAPASARLMTSPLPHRVVFAKKNEKQKKQKHSKTDLLKQSTEKKNDSQKKQKHTQKPNRAGGARNRTIQKINKNRLKKKSKKNQKKSKKNQKETKK